MADARTDDGGASRFSLTSALVRQLLRYLGVSAIALVVDVGTMALLTYALGVNYLVAATVGFCFGLAVNYTLARLWAFAGDRRTVTNTYAEFAVFAGIGVVGLLLNDLVVWLVTERLHAEPIVSKLVATAIVFVWNFGMRKVLLFRQP